MSKYEVFSGPYFPVFGLNTGKYGPEITPYLDTFHAVIVAASPQTNDENGLLSSAMRKLDFETET